MAPNQRRQGSLGTTKEVLSSDLLIADPLNPDHPNPSREAFRFLVRTRRRLQHKRKAADTNEGQEAYEDRKRARRARHSTGEFLVLSLESDTTREAGKKNNGRHAQHDLFDEGRAQRKLRQATKRLSFPPPRLPMPAIATNVSPRTQRQLRNSSYERRHGGNLFTIYEDETATSDPAYVFGRGYTNRTVYPRSSVRRSTEDWDQGQENLRRGGNTMEPTGSTNEQRELPMPVSPPTAPSCGFRTPEKEMSARLTAAAKILRMMR